MYTITTQLAQSRHAEFLQEAGRARLIASARVARRPARHGRPAVTAASRVVRAVLLRPAV
jgi:hypothetical protein